MGSTFPKVQTISIFFSTKYLLYIVVISRIVSEMGLKRDKKVGLTHMNKK